MKNLSDVEKAERVLKGYCDCCYMPKDKHLNNCVHYDWQVAAMQVLVGELKAEIDRDIINQIIKTANQ